MASAPLTVTVDISVLYEGLARMGAALAHARAVLVCGEVLAPIPGERFECCQLRGHDSPHCDAARTITWY
jgi:hypothetical protein